MKKLMMMLVVMALLMSFPVAAVAKKPAQPPGQDPKLVGYTCQDYQEMGLFQGEFLVGVPADFPVEDGDFSLPLDSAHPAACIDVMSSGGDWSFEFEAIGSVAWLEMQIKDSVPGDFCFRHGWGKRNDPIPADPFSVGMPEAGENACTPGEVGLASDDNAALVFMVAYTPERNATASAVTITVDLPES